MIGTMTSRRRRLVPFQGTKERGDGLEGHGSRCGGIGTRLPRPATKLMRIMIRPEGGGGSLVLWAAAGHFLS